MRYTLEHWEDDELIVCIDGRPVGKTLTRGHGEIIIDWLKTTRI